MKVPCEGADTVGAGSGDDGGGVQGPHHDPNSGHVGLGRVKK